MAIRLVTADDAPPAIGDVVSGVHVEGFEVIGRIERQGFVRTDDGKLYDMRKSQLTVVQRCNAPTVRVGGWLYFAAAVDG